MKIWHPIKPILSLSLSLYHFYEITSHSCWSIYLKIKQSLWLCGFLFLFIYFQVKRQVVNQYDILSYRETKYILAAWTFFFLFQWIRKGLKLLIWKEWRLLWHYAEILQFWKFLIFKTFLRFFKSFVILLIEYFHTFLILKSKHLLIKMTHNKIRFTVSTEAVL